MKRNIAVSLIVGLIVIFGGCRSDGSAESAMLLAEIESLRQELEESRSENELSVNDDEVRIVESIPESTPQPPSEPPSIPTPEPTPTPPKEIHLFNSPFYEIGNLAWFFVAGDEHNNKIRLMNYHGAWFSGDIRSHYIVYSLDTYANAEFTATINPHEVNAMTKVYRFYGDGRLLWTSPIIHHAVSPISVEIDVSGVSYLKIEVEFTRGEVGYGVRGLAASLGDISNAKIVAIN